MNKIGIEGCMVDYTCISRRRGPERTMLNVAIWSDSGVDAVKHVKGVFGIRAMSVLDIPLEVISCIDRVDVPPGTREYDVAMLLIEQLLERAGRKVEAVDLGREARGSTPLMGRLRARLRLELEGLYLAELTGLGRDIRIPNSRGGALLAELRARAGIPKEARTLMWRIRKVWYGEWRA